MPRSDKCNKMLHKFLVDKIKQKSTENGLFCFEKSKISEWRLSVANATVAMAGQDHVDAHVHARYDLKEKLGKGVGAHARLLTRAQTRTHTHTHTHGYIFRQSNRRL